MGSSEHRAQPAVGGKAWGSSAASSGSRISDGVDGTTSSQSVGEDGNDSSQQSTSSVTSFETPTTELNETTANFGAGEITVQPSDGSGNSEIPLVPFDEEASVEGGEVVSGSVEADAIVQRGADEHPDALPQPDLQAVAAVLPQPALAPDAVVFADVDDALSKVNPSLAEYLRNMDYFPELKNDAVNE